MILLLDTSTPTCYVTLVDGEWWHDVSWDAGRELAHGLLGFVERELQGQNKELSDVTGLGVLRGPGSFTGLRIGITVMNTLADGLSLPIVGETGEEWQKKSVDRLQKGENDRIVLPFYDSDARITQPRK